MPGKVLYNFSAMTLMKRGDGCCQDRVIDAVRFEYSEDGSTTWKKYNGGKYVKTGQTAAQKNTEQVKFKIDPPITANRVRVFIDKDHANGGWYNGRFDLWATKA